MSSEAQVMDAVETTVDVATDVVETTQEVFRNNPKIIIGVGVASLLVGAGVATIASRLYFKTKYERIAEEEIREARDFYSKKNKTEEYSDPSVLAEKYIEEKIEEEQKKDIQTAAVIMDKAGYTPYHKVPKSEEAKVEVTSVTQNIFTNHEPVDLEDDFDFDDEHEKDLEGKPFIVEHDNFFENEDEYEQLSFTYFEGDDVLADEQDQMIRDYIQIIGHDNLKFGRGSKDKNVVYVRNRKLETDYEINRSNGSYSEEVLGFHDDEPKAPLRKFRNTD